MPEKQVDEQQVREQEARNKGMHPLDEKNTMASFTDAENTGTGDGIPDTLSGSPEEEEQPAQQSSTDDDEQNVGNIQQQSSEESVDDSEGSPSQESESEEEEQTGNEQPESEGEEETDFGDFMMSLGDDGINITKAEKSKSESSEQSQDTSNLSDKERARLWQSNYDKERAKRIELENRIAAFENGKSPDKQSQSDQEDSTQQKQPTRFNKQPADFMPQGSEFDETEALDPSTLSGQAYTKWLDARDQHNQQQFRQQLFSELDQRENQRKQKETYQKQIDYLKDKAKVSDDEVKDLLQFAATPRQDGLYLIHLARKLANGQLPLSGKALAQLRKLYEPEKKATSTVAQKSSTPKQKKSSETDIFADGWNTTI